jgi:hypothetical protein
MMITYVLGAGASYHAGYPLANSMGSELFHWMKKQVSATGYAARFPATAQFFEELFGSVGNIEDLMTRMQKMIDDYEDGTSKQRATRSQVANERGVLVEAVRGWFAEIRQQDQAQAYQLFARNIIRSGDCIITFNYDVALDRELGLAGKFAVGDGYGFLIEGLPGKSAVRILKLHGSTNWLALIFGGMSGFGQIQPGNTLGSRPVIGKNELAFLGCPDASDPAFQKSGGALPVMIMPTRSKEFFFAANTGIEYVEFWNELWQQASAALQASDGVMICGYGMLPVDQRACDLLLNAPPKNAEVTISCGRDTSRIVQEYQQAGYSQTKPAEEILFENLVHKASSASAA